MKYLFVFAIAIFILNTNKANAACVGKTAYVSHEKGAEFLSDSTPGKWIKLPQGTEVQVLSVDAKIVGTVSSYRVLRQVITAFPINNGAEVTCQVQKYYDSGILSTVHGGYLTNVLSCQ